MKLLKRILNEILLFGIGLYAVFVITLCELMGLSLEE